MTKKASKRGPLFVFSGNIAPVTGKWHAIYFEVAGDGADEETVETLPVACWAACVRGKEHIVGGMVAGVSGLELAELDRDFRGYVAVNDDDARSDFVEVWERENGYGEDEPEEEDDPRDEEE